jgi:hypothetical protein
MSLQLLAKQMESKGRDGDSVLVHMTHGEVAGLQKLAESAGGSLSVNPETGLVEANFLKSMLPTIVGLAVGAATMNPMLGAAAGAAVGGYQARRNDQDVGMGMLMGGLGGYGGASMAGGLSAAAPAAAGTAGAGMGAGAAGTVSGSVAPSAVAGTIPGTTAIGAGSQSAMLAAQNAGQMGSQVATYGSSVNPIITEQAAKSVADMTMSEKLARFGQGFQGMGTEAGRAAALKSMGGSQGVMNAMQMAALPALNAADAYDRTPGPHPLLSTDLNQTGGGAFKDIRAYEPAMPRYTAQRGNVFVPTFTAAEGGLASLAKGGMESGGFVVPADVTSLVGEGNTEAGYKRISAIFPGAVPIRGEDGGQADTVKTNIEGKQPAAVAHGEMYIPRKTVEEKGGAKKLYAMMDRVREQATGSKKQIKPVSLKQAMA